LQINRTICHLWGSDFGSPLPFTSNNIRDTAQFRLSAAVSGIRNRCRIVQVKICLFFYSQKLCNQAGEVPTNLRLLHLVTDLIKVNMRPEKKTKSHQETVSGCHSSTCDKKNGCKWKVILDTQDFSLNKHGLTEE